MKKSHRAHVALAAGLVLGLAVAAWLVLGGRGRSEAVDFEPFPPDEPRLSPEERAKLDWAGMLRGAVAPATRVRVRSGGLCHRTEAEEETLFETTDVATIRALVQTIDIDASRGDFACMCCGNPTLEFYDGGKLLAEVGFHHGKSLRWRSWPSDALLTRSSSQALVQWLADHGVAGPRREIEDARNRANKSKAASLRWTSAMPPSLREAWDARGLERRGRVTTIPSEPPAQRAALPSPGDPRAGDGTVDELERLLVAAVPEKSARILALLGWFGSGDGRWSTYPTYEEVAESLLLRYSVDDVVAAADVPTLTEAQTEGTARYFASWGFWVYRRGEEARVPPSLRARLWQHVRKGGDADKLLRMGSTFRDDR